MPSTHFTVNQTPATHQLALYQLISTMIAAGWTMVRSSDGTTAGAGVNVTSGATGAGGFNNAGAWVCLQQPSGNVSPYSGSRQLVLQNQGQNGTGLRIIYSRQGLFTGGTATVSASATDETTIFGGGSAASPQYYTWTNQAVGQYRCETLADDGSTGTKFPFGVYLMCFANGGATQACGGFVMDPVSNYETGDADPFVFFGATANTSACTFGNDLSLSSGGTIVDATKAGYNKGFAHTWVNAAAVNSLPANWDAVQALVLTDNGSNLSPNSSGGGFGTSPVTGNDVQIPVIWGRNSTRTGATGWKGVSMMLRWKATTRSTGSTISVASVGAKDWLIMGDLAFPWNGSSPVV